MDGTRLWCLPPLPGADIANQSQRSFPPSQNEASESFSTLAGVGTGKLISLGRNRKTLRSFRSQEYRSAPLNSPPCPSNTSQAPSTATRPCARGQHNYQVPGGHRRPCQLNSHQQHGCSASEVTLPLGTVCPLLLAPEVWEGCSSSGGPWGLSCQEVTCLPSAPTPRQRCSVPAPACVLPPRAPGPS